MKKKIAILPGDGIGPEIIREAVKVLKAVEKSSGAGFEFREGIIGAVAIDKCGDPYPPETHKLCISSDAVLFGAVGDPKYDNNPAAKIRPEQGLLRMRKELGLYANIRPVELFWGQYNRSPLKEEVVRNTDMVIVRELTGGIYFGEPRGRSDDRQEAFDTCRYTTGEILRISEKTFNLAEKRRGVVTLVDKANVLETSRLWREVVTRLHKDKYSHLILDYLYVDNAAMKIVTNPSAFDVILTENMFGDILSDLASVLTGSVGLLASASCGTGVSLYEPVHGSYPQAAGLDKANPLATILSAAMMLDDSFGMHRESNLIRNACRAIIEKGIVTEDLSDGKDYFTTSEVGDAVAKQIIELVKNIKPLSCPEVG
ncbi:MAG: 3-isopropylmalate dehydrogenase [Bacteroidales bacterium]|nr:3-isopropylmalate dehydrogenase [Bacteroidales bacterium]MDD2425661.1 3-isopropylmalate dehydrogenase [Bacteroidales bacterium]